MLQQGIQWAPDDDLSVSRPRDFVFYALTSILCKYFDPVLVCNVHRPSGKPRRR